MATVYGRYAAHGLGTDTAGDWRQDGICRDEDPELFFPISSGIERELQTEKARKVCDRCAVKPDCRKWALEEGEPFGIWGGLSEEERRRLNPSRRTTRKSPDARTKCRNGHELNDPDAVVLNARGERCCVQCRINRHKSAVTAGATS